ALVIRASPVGQPPIVRHSSKSSGPAPRWMAPSTPPPPKSVVFAAWTTASTACVVMSPWTASSLVMGGQSSAHGAGGYCEPGPARRSPAGRDARPGRDLIERVRKALGDRYTVLTAVGRGGNASIFAARDSRGAQVAIKVLHPELAVSVAADRFLREIRFASQLNHPHIARMMDSGEADYLLWYVMPYLPGDTLRQT